MRIREVRISGFRSIPFCADCLPAGTAGRGHRGAIRIAWAADAFQVKLPVQPRVGQPLLRAVMGANSAGKSNILLALDTFFGAAVKLEPGLYNGKRFDRPLVVELTLEGQVVQPGAWHVQHCTPHGAGHRLTVASVWQDESRTRYIRRADGVYLRQTQQDRAQVERLLPQFRILWADRHLADEANLERRSLVSDLVEAMLVEAAGGDSAVTRMAALLDDLAALVATREADAAWQPVRALETSLAQGLASITPQPKSVHLRLERGLPSLRGLFGQGSLSLDDGVELDFAQHGLGIQRGLAVAALHAWCQTSRRAGHDYLFALEEPEIYLHPHATRVLLNLLERIGQRDQVIFTTHASEFINRVPLGQIIAVQRADCGGQVCSRAVRPDLAGLPAEEVVKVQRYLREDRSDMLFARAVLLVEGQAEYFALPGFARTLGLDLDAAGVSIVFVNGIGNFAVYHRILAAFCIPHAILMDGDGEAAARRRSYAPLADALFVLAQDFEQILVDGLTPARLLALVNACLARKGRPPQTQLADLRRRGQALAALGKPLVGRVAGEMLAREEVAALPAVVEALAAVVRLGGVGGSPAR